MNALVKDHAKKQKEVTALESRHEKLQAERAAFKQKLDETRKVLLEAELGQIELLRRSWSPRQVDHAVRKFEDVAAGQRSNVCAPGTAEEELESFRSEIDGALVTAYGQAAVQKMKASAMAVREAVQNLEDLMMKVGCEIDEVEGQLMTAKQELLKLDSKICADVYLSIRDEVHTQIVPKLRRVFVAVNLHNPYAVQWGDARFYFDLFHSTGKNECTRAELLKLREELRKEVGLGN